MSLIKNSQREPFRGRNSHKDKEALDVLQITQTSLLKNLVFIAGCDKMREYILVHYAGRTRAHEYREKTL